MAAQIQLRRDSAANWIAANPILASGEFGFETDTGKLKLGNGISTWTTLPYYRGTEGNYNITAGEAIGGHKVLVMITSKAYLFDPTNSAHYGIVIGMSSGAAILNDLVAVQIYGAITLVGWGLVDGPQFAQLLGAIGPAPPGTGIVQPMGVSVGTDSLLIDIQRPILQV